MSEFQPFIEREVEDHILRFQLGKEVVKLALNIDNTLLVEHDFPEKEMDYIIRRNDDDEFLRVWRQDDWTNLFETLADKGFDVLYRNRPTPDDQEAWLIHNMRDVEEI